LLSVLRFFSFIVFITFFGLAPNDVAWAESAVLAKAAAASVTADDVAAELANLPAEQAQHVRESATPASVVTDILVRRLVAQNAEQDRLADTNPLVADRLRLARERVLYDAYMERAEARSLPDAATLEALAREEYQVHPERYTTPEEIHASHILVRACGGDPQAAQTRADALLARLRAGESFADLARTESDDVGTAKKGGDLGFFPRGKMVAQFDQAAFDLKKPGDLSPVVKTEFGLHIIRLDERRPAARHPYQDVRQALVDRERARLRSEIRAKIIATLKDSQNIQYDLPAAKAALAN
jgi:peptidyl-prolyl cis-trans isomerase C